MTDDTKLDPTQLDAAIYEADELTLFAAAQAVEHLRGSEPLAMVLHAVQKQLLTEGIGSDITDDDEREKYTFFRGLERVLAVVMDSLQHSNGISGMERRIEKVAPDGHFGLIVAPNGAVLNVNKLPEELRSMLTEGHRQHGDDDEKGHPGQYL